MIGATAVILLFLGVPLAGYLYLVRPASGSRRRRAVAGIVGYLAVLCVLAVVLSFAGARSSSFVTDHINQARPTQPASH